MANISTIEVKDIKSVEKYAAQYVNGEHVTLITKDGTKYYTDGVGGYYVLGETISSGDTPSAPADTEKVDLMTTLKELAAKASILKSFEKDTDGNLVFNGAIVVKKSDMVEVEPEKPEEPKEPVVPDEPSDTESTEPEGGEDPNPEENNGEEGGETDPNTP